jgi:RasGEF N-terminal motif
LTRPDYTDAHFQDAFLLIHRCFISATDLTKLLLERYTIEPPANLPPRAYSLWKIQKQQPIQARVIEVFSMWFTLHYERNTDDEDLVGLLCDKLAELGALSPEPGLAYLIKTLEGRVANLRRTPRYLIPGPDIPHLLSPANNRVLNSSPAEVARQLTLIEANLQYSVTTSKLLKRSPPADNPSLESLGTLRVTYPNVEVDRWKYPCRRTAKAASPSDFSLDSDRCSKYMFSHNLLLTIQDVSRIG